MPGNRGVHFVQTSINVGTSSRGSLASELLHTVMPREYVSPVVMKALPLKTSKYASPLRRPHRCLQPEILLPNRCSLQHRPYQSTQRCPQPQPVLQPQLQLPTLRCLQPQSPAPNAAPQNLCSARLATPLSQWPPAAKLALRPGHLHSRLDL